MKIYHNPRCRKSREALELLTKNGVKLEVIEYLNTPPSEQELREIVAYLGVSPEEIVRKGEPEYKENFKGKMLNDEQWIKALIDYPKLMERPIVVKNKKAVVGRPPENVLRLL
jgi:arsenate reductase (glutaredoxin)